ncbi:MAG: hypothetical protein ACI8XB_002967, partial [Patiriisocius sp.]
MKIEGKEILFPAEAELSFNKLLNIIEERKNSVSKLQSKYYQDVLDHFAKSDLSRDGVTSDQLKKNKDLVDELMMVVFPEALTTNEIKGATGPWQFETFYQSSRLKQISKNGDVKTIFNFDLLNEDQYYIAACTSILSVY